MKASPALARALLAALLIAALLLPMIAPTYYLQFFAKAMLLAIVAASLNLVVGFGGMVSLCHGAFFGLAGYVLALASPSSSGASLWTSLPLALLVVAVAAALVGALALRTRGIYFIMATLAFGEMFFYFFHDTRVANGSDGIYIYFEPEIVIAGWRLVDLGNKTSFYYVALASLQLAIIVISTLVRSPFGAALMAARDNEQRARSLGFPVFRIRLTAFVLAAVLAGIAGYFSASQFGFVAPQTLGWHVSATLLIMVVLGGMKSVLGPVFGAFALLGLEEILKSNIEHWKLIEGVIVIALVFMLPGGLQHLAQLVFADRRAPAGQPGSGASSAGRQHHG